MANVLIHSAGDIVNGRYKITESIGRGAMGEVYVALDTSASDCEIAIKYLKLQQGHTSALEQFKSEFALLTHLSHPNIAKVYDLMQDEKNQQFFFTSELVKGCEFLAATQNLSLDEIEDLFVQTLRALEYLHGNGIFHFDIKSANLLVSEGDFGLKEKILRGTQYNIKLIDFGLATLRFQGRMAGTPSYMAPERVGRENPDGRSDI